MNPRFTLHDSRFTRLWVALLLIPVLASGQRGVQDYEAEVPYNGGFTFTRIRYGGYGFRGSALGA